VKPNAISLRRRQLMLAGLAGVTAPLTGFAAQRGAAQRDARVAGITASPGHGTEKLIVSGRIVGANRKPLAGALVEAWHPEASTDHGASVATDADGRFMLTTRSPGGHSGQPQPLHCRVSHERHPARVTQLHFARPERDEAGVWRATFGVTLA
jgi:protocatechuate 3,4-dioxygenase beta subunit